MDSLRILSLARNQIKKIENLEAVAETLEELWISYNLLEKLTNLEKLSKLRVLFLSNNKIAEWAEIERLAQLPALEDLLLVGNPLTEKYNVSAADNPSKPGSTWRLAVLQRLPGLKKLDGILVDREEVEQAAAQKAVS
ncbi:axonemal dynein light chain 1 [Klebsormidium nitens]|uniref:Axonemal dynein light chain 1 n=1 Tax=Klebsormidium nitens TaxID=105231 RepID=A0A1Y1IHR3_KLENI|nr:axonemal dynein light chain 1 [Klebsormidium nitens]|eukprot:GAQ89622.1 axonemal dynein light chain 1 [Klebsormidium nitens]